MFRYLSTFTEDNTTEDPCARMFPANSCATPRLTARKEAVNHPSNHCIRDLAKIQTNFAWTTKYQNSKEALNKSRLPPLQKIKGIWTFLWRLLLPLLSILKAALPKEHQQNTSISDLFILAQEKTTMQCKCIFLII